MQRAIAFKDLQTSDLVVDALYKGGTRGNISDEPLDKLLGVGNQGGFRYLRRRTSGELLLCVLYSDFANPDWPDEVNLQLGFGLLRQL